MSDTAYCPRNGCGEPVRINQAGKIDTHKLPDGWRACAASGETLDDAAKMSPPQPKYTIYANDIG